ncbi:MAG: polymerase III, alpha subunit protein [candidate division TM6 bacterium GW2011_GWE2_42_60]|nr:MAG: polymerase III, alpha subunit protein [candidate division TM6 bacterium GW2011_GWE2_42_60]HBY06237.1 DNA polymerase III subunit alpha [Candidatus Dependentiae bacterium]
MAQQFVPLHLHTEYSLLDGALTIENLLEFTKEHRLSSVGISDHGNIFGAVAFFQACKKANVKPILGMEAYVTPDTAVRDNSERYFHLLLLVKNKTGYRNLCKLIHASYTKGFYFKPRVDYKMLAEFSEGLIASSACLGGQIPQLLLHNKELEARTLIEKYQTIFGAENFYLEVQPAGQQEQKIVNQKIFDLGKELSIPVFASADSHYYKAEDKYAHEVMLAIQTKAKMSDDDRYSFGAECLVHLYTPQEMLDAFPGREDVVWRSGEIADRCDFSFDFGKHFFPSFAIPTQESEEVFFARICTEGLQELFDKKRISTDDPKRYWDRLEIELALITKMGFITYFLVVSDFIQWAKDNDIPVGPGRGSAAGSLVAWAMKITDIDPLKYNLLFERFLNPERVTMPDIDIDFCIEGRERVIDYVRERYGHDKVCQIITFGTMMAKGVIKDVGRALGIPFDDTNAITDLIPDQLKITLKEAIVQEPRLALLRDSNPMIGQLLEVAFKLEGLTRHASKHAAGIVITPEPISDMLPIYIPPKTTDLVTQYAMTEIESLGFLKMDFLGLKNLTLIKRVITTIKKNHGIAIDPNYLPPDDQPTFDLLARGETTGVFQFESSGIRDVLRRLKPSYFEDIIAVNALYRPGPLGSGMVDDFIERRHGRQEIKYLFPELEPILKETYGVIVYQEQVMRIASAIGQYSLGEADILRRAMGKKKADVMAQQRSIFVERAVKANFNEQKAGDLFDLMAYFAGYGFNKSHSAAYGMIAYQTAYLKAHYPTEFMAGLISLESQDPEKMASYIQDAREMGIPVLPPDVNASEHDFDAKKGEIRFGLIGIKNAGESGLQSCLEERANKGPFKDLLNFCCRVDLRTCNKRFIESLIAAGAFDSLPGNRAQKTAELGTIIDRALEKKEALLTGQMGLFAALSPTKEAGELYAFTPCDDWPTSEKLEKEKEVLGIYLSARPLDAYKRHLTWLNALSFAKAREQKGFVLCGGFKKEYKVINTKKGDRMAFLTLEDYQERAEIILFPKLFAKISTLLEQHNAFLVLGTIDETGSMCKIKANDLIPLDTIFSDWSLIDKVSLALPAGFEATILQQAKQHFVPGKARFEFVFSEQGKQLALAVKGRYSCDLDTLTLLHEQQVQISITLA